MEVVILFETERLSVRSATLQDAEMYFKLWSDPQVMKNVGFPQGYPVTLDEVKESIRKQGPPPFDHMLVVTIKESGEAIGECKIETPDREGLTETHIKILPPHWGHKYGLEIKRGLLDYIFTQTDCLVVQSTPNVGNIPSIKMQEAVGGVRVGEDTHEFPDEMKDYTCPVHYYIYHVRREDWKWAHDDR